MKLTDDSWMRFTKPSGDDVNALRRMSIISEGEQPSVQMANLGIVGSHKVKRGWRHSTPRDYQNHFPRFLRNDAGEIHQ